MYCILVKNNAAMGFEIPFFPLMWEFFMIFLLCPFLGYGMLIYLKTYAFQLHMSIFNQKNQKEKFQHPLLY